ncbi:MAG: InlB B-repeat-containing protein [Bifidobacterium pseudocatenulatum]
MKTITNPFDRPGYTFSGWNTQADGKGKAYATGADYVLTGQRQVHAEEHLRASTRSGKSTVPA